jgi:uncharacterized protein (TIGR00255 family)
MPIRSMTGFARVSRVIAAGELTLSIKSVNHRGLDIHFHAPAEFDAVEPALRSALRKRLARGHVQVQVYLKRAPESEGAAAFNEPLLRSWLQAFRAASEHFGLDGKPDLNQALRVPGIIEARSSDPAAAVHESEAVEAMEAALAELDQFRLREGAAIETDLRGRTATLRDITLKMEQIRNRALPFFQQRLRDKLSELLGGAFIDPSRLAQEAALIAERSDVSEELVRLRAHSEQLDALLESSSEAGKKLDFLLQEMNRETNTILSKTTGLGEPGLAMTDLGLAAKAEIDRIREQSLNIE